MKNLIYLSIAIFIVAGCKTDKPDVVQDVPTAQPTEKTINMTRAGFKLKSVYSAEKDETTFTIKKDQTVTYQLPGKIEQNFVADLDGDKVQEIYIHTENKSKKSTLSGYVLGPNGVMEVYLPPIANKPVGGTSTFRPFKGQILETFNVNIPDQATVSKQLLYNLVRGEAGYQLRPEGYNTSKLNSLIGQYASKDGTNNAEYKVMMITKNDAGEWVVNIKIKRTNDKKVLCDFTSVGHFYDRDLYVPLGFDNPALKGNLRVSFLDNNASVYTQDAANAKEMIAVCNGQHSISGNFKKTDI